MGGQGYGDTNTPCPRTALWKAAMCEAAIYTGMDHLFDGTWRNKRESVWIHYILPGQTMDTRDIFLVCI